MINDTVKVSKLIRKCTKGAWYNASYSGTTFKYRFISVTDIDSWNDYAHSIKANIEVEVIDSFYSKWSNKIQRENRDIRNLFFYKDSNDLMTLLKLFSLDARNLKIKSIKRKK
jgi:hypothetical protein